MFYVTFHRSHFRGERKFGELVGRELKDGEETFVVDACFPISESSLPKGAKKYFEMLKDIGFGLRDGILNVYVNRVEESGKEARFMLEARWPSMSGVVSKTIGGGRVNLNLVYYTRLMEYEDFLRMISEARIGENKYDLERLIGVEWGNLLRVNVRRVCSAEDLGEDVRGMGEVYRELGFGDGKVIEEIVGMDFDFGNGRVKGYCERGFPVEDSESFGKKTERAPRIWDGKDKEGYEKIVRDCFLNQGIEFPEEIINEGEVLEMGFEDLVGILPRLVKSFERFANG